MNIYVGNLPRETSESEIRELFEQYGEVKTVSLIKDKFTNVLKGFGFVEMDNKDEAEKAISNLNGTMFTGRRLTVNVARPKSESRNRTKRFNPRFK